MRALVLTQRDQPKSQALGKAAWGASLPDSAGVTPPTQVTPLPLDFHCCGGKDQHTKLTLGFTMGHEHHPKPWGAPQAQAVARSTTEMVAACLQLATAIEMKTSDTVTGIEISLY